LKSNFVIHNYDREILTPLAEVKALIDQCKREYHQSNLPGYKNHVAFQNTVFQ